MNFRPRRTEEPEINLIPFIDVLLVVLIFLMLSTTYSKFTELQLTCPWPTPSSSATARAKCRRRHRRRPLRDRQAGPGRSQRGRCGRRPARGRQGRQRQRRHHQRRRAAPPVRGHRDGGRAAPACRRSPLPRKRLPERR
jgi:hypothetical protein